ncbi:MAG: hypothetical protein ACUVSP_09685, partial [Desulfotomaculales bacterium]
LLLAASLVIGLAGCGGSQVPAPGDGKQSAQGEVQQRETNKPAGGAWPEWSGPKSLGPAKPLPELWYVEFAHFPEKGSAHCYKIHVDAKGNWGDTFNDKGQLTAEELAGVKAALAKVDWGRVPQWKTKDYTAYTVTPKSWPFPSDDPYYQVMVWLGQTHSSPPYDGRAIVADFKAPCAPEIKEIIDVMKALQEKYQPQIH